MHDVLLGSDLINPIIGGVGRCQISGEHQIVTGRGQKIRRHLRRDGVCAGKCRPIRDIVIVIAPTIVPCFAADVMFG